MCEYCEKMISDGINVRGRYLADSGYEDCCIIIDDGKFFIRVAGANVCRGVEINCCPMCGRNLKENNK